MQYLQSENSLSDALSKLGNQVYSVWRQRWIMLFVLCLICIIGWYVVYTFPEKYEANARVIVDTQTLLKPLLKGIAVDSDYTQQFALMAERTLLTRPNLERLISSTRLSESAQTERQTDRLIRSLSKNIRVEGVTRRHRRGEQSSIYTLSYRNEDAELSYDVVRSLLSIFIDSSLDQNQREGVIAREFLDKQIVEYEEKLVVAEKSLMKFKRANVGMMPTQAGDYFQRYSVASDNLKQAILQLNEAEQKRNQLSQQIQDFDSFELFTPGGVNSDSQLLDPLAVRIRALQIQLDQLLLQYTERHPNVITARSTLKNLARQRAEMLSNPESKKDLNMQNPVYQELTLNLGGAEAEVAGLLVRVEKYEQEVNELNRLIDTIPQVEAELSQLNRDYDINQKNYDELVARRKSAKISKDAEADSDQVLYQVIDPPRVPLTPLGPNRAILHAGVFAAASILAILLSWLISQLKSNFVSVRNLREEIDFPVLGSVSTVYSGGDIAWSYARHTMFFALLSILLGIFIFLVANSLFGGVSEVQGLVL